MQNIADELGNGKSYIYHYYSDKQSLKNSFLDYILNRMENASGNYSENSPAEKFDKMLDDVFAIQEDKMKDFRTAVMEMKAQTPHNEAFAESFREMDRLMTNEFTQVLRKNDVKRPGVKAELLVSTVEGLMDRKIGYNKEENLEELKTELKEQYIEGENIASK